MSTLDIDTLALPGYVAQEHGYDRAVVPSWGSENGTEIVSAFKYLLDGRHGSNRRDYGVVAVLRNRRGTEWSMIYYTDKVRVIVPRSRRTDESIRRLRTAITRVPQHAIACAVRDELQAVLDELQRQVEQERADR